MDGRILDIDKQVRVTSHGADVAAKLDRSRNTPPMTLLDRFRTQPQRHADPAVRLAYVGEIPLTEREVIAAIAREDEDRARAQGGGGEADGSGRARRDLARRPRRIGPRPRR